MVFDNRPVSYPTAPFIYDVSKVEALDSAFDVSGLSHSTKWN